MYNIHGGGFVRFKYYFKKSFQILLIALLIILLSTGSAQVEGDNFLWEISGEEGEFYLMGSLHFMPQGSYPLDDEIYNALSKSDLLAVELDLRKLDQQTVQQYVQKHGLFHDQTRLNNVLEEETYEKVIELTTDYGFAESQVDLFKPWYVSQVISDIVFQEVGLESAEGVDLHMLKKADEKAIEIKELESFEGQMDIISNMEMDLQIAVLEDTLSDLDYQAGALEELVEEWHNGEVEPIYEFLFANREDNPDIEEYYQKVFDERESSLKDKILELLSDYDRPFIVVGSGHIINDEGLLYLFEKAGYETEQL